jgi:hypothetical protein
VTGKAWVDEASGDVYASEDATEPLHCIECGNLIGMKAFSIGPDGDARHDGCGPKRVS